MRDRPRMSQAFGWPSDFTRWHLADGTEVEIISWLDDDLRRASRLYHLARSVRRSPAGGSSPSSMSRRSPSSPSTRPRSCRPTGIGPTRATGATNDETPANRAVADDRLIASVTHDATHVSPMSRLKTFVGGGTKPPLGTLMSRPRFSWRSR